MAKEKKNKVFDEDVVNMIKRIDRMQGEIVSKLEEVYQKGNITYHDIDAYLSNRGNFSENQWRFLKKEREIWLEKIWGLLGDKTKAKHEEKLKKKKTGERKRKTLGDRKKWIPMR